MAHKLNFHEREKIFEYLNKSYKMEEIAQCLNRHISTIYREINRFQGNYSPITSQEDSILKSKNSKKKEKFQNENLNIYVVEKIKLFWSPQQISNRLKIDFPNDNHMRVSVETIYKFIYNIKDPYEKNQLIKYLRRRKKYRYSRKNKNEKRGKILNIKSIHERPSFVQERNDLGHWEGDTVVGKDHKSAIGTLVERKTRLTIIVSLKNGKDAAETTKAFIDKFNGLPLFLKKSLTYDRGMEMAFHEKFTQATGMPVYFADPYSPWQRGSNENTNGLIRTFFPKGTDFAYYSEEDLAKVENILNNRPRKVLKYLTPNEFLQAHNIRL